MQNSRVKIDGQEEEIRITRFPRQLIYTQKFFDDAYEFRNVILTEELYLKVKGMGRRLFTPEEWRSLGIEGSKGWEHYAWHYFQPHVIMLRKSRRPQELIQAKSEKKRLSKLFCMF